MTSQKSPTGAGSVKPTQQVKMVWLNGELVPYAEVRVPLLSHTLHYGTGAFEGIRAYRSSGGVTHIFRGREHLERLVGSIRSLGMHCPFSVSDLLQGCIEAIRANGLDECYVRPIAFLGDQYLGLKLPYGAQAEIAIIPWNWGKYLGSKIQDEGARVMISSFRRADPSSFMPLAKVTGAYVTSVLARQQASECQKDEAILLDPQGFIAEGSGENIFVVKDGEISTPPPESILPGITRDSVMSLIRRAKIPLHERRILRNELVLADEVFFTGTAIEINPVVQVDASPIGTGKPGPITKGLLTDFLKLVRGDLPEFSSWLERV